MNTVAYVDSALKKFIGKDSSEDPTALIRLLEKKNFFSLGSRSATNEKNIYHNRRKTFSDPFYTVHLLNGSIHFKLS